MSSNNNRIHLENEHQEDVVRKLIQAVGDDPERKGLVRTPKRYLKALADITSGYEASVKEVINDAIFEIPEVSSSEMVIVKDIEIYSLCEHHLLPFFGKCHVGYIPNGRIIGLSKIPRIVEVYARRLQVQERLCGQVAQCLMEELQPKGVGVVIEAYHFCMMMRGVEKQSSFAKTSSLLGDFRGNGMRTEFFNLIN